VGGGGGGEGGGERKKMNLALTRLDQQHQGKRARGTTEDLEKNDSNTSCRTEIIKK